MIRILAALTAALIAAGVTDALAASPLLLAGLTALAAAAGAALAPARAFATDPVAPPAPPPEPAADPGPSVAAVIDSFDAPVLLIERQRVTVANAAARAALGEHIVGEDARLAIRHPAAADRLIGRRGDMSPDEVEIANVGTPERRWLMTVHPLEEERRLVRLIDRTSSHAAERMRVDFVANASHELRTPLATLIGFIETLEEGTAGGDPATRARFLKIMAGEAKRMQRLVDDLMSLSRIEADRFSHPQDRVALPGLVGEVRRGTVGGLGEDAGRIVTEIADDLPAVTGDAAQLSQLLHNLIGNAIKYARPATPVTVTLRRARAGMVRLSVADEGEGIAPEHLPRLTERFYRVDPGRSRAGGGTGLGLAIVKHIVERHRGRLDIASEVGRGTTVSVLLPAAPPPDAPEMPAAGTPAAPAVTKA